MIFKAQGAWKERQVQALQEAINELAPQSRVEKVRVQAHVQFPKVLCQVDVDKYNRAAAYWGKRAKEHLIPDLAVAAIFATTAFTPPVVQAAVGFTAVSWLWINYAQV